MEHLFVDCKLFAVDPEYSTAVVLKLGFVLGLMALSNGPLELDLCSLVRGLTLCHQHTARVRTRPVLCVVLNNYKYGDE
jgi:hypothetical protein